VALTGADVSAPPRVKSASLSVRAGEIVGLAGLVGSGRTSLALAAVGGRPDERPPGGTVRLDGKAVRFSSPSDALASGVAYITEDRKQFGLFPAMATAAKVAIDGLDANRARSHCLHRHDRRCEGLFAALDAARRLSPPAGRRAVGERGVGGKQNCGPRVR